MHVPSRIGREKSVSRKVLTKETEIAEEKEEKEDKENEEKEQEEEEKSTG